MKLIWTEFAAEQLESIYVFIKNKSEIAAVGIYNDILDEVDSLLHFPYMAPLEGLLSEFTESYRSLVVRNIYKVVYYTNNETIYIVAVFDCRQSPEKLKRLLVRKNKT
jgi:plasmid stabilization system protein ParE